jgi:hypothetical protein
MMTMAIFAVPQFVGIVDDDLQLATIQLFDHVDNTLLQIEFGQVTIQPANIRFYKAEVTILAQLEGLQYYMKKWFILTLLVIVSMMASTQFIISMVISYYIWRLIKGRIHDHLDYGNRHNSM